jgi:ABC-type transport system involved in multi-copper enzyme maturation permease subunit
MMTKILLIARNELKRYIRDLRFGLFLIAIAVATICTAYSSAIRYRVVLNETLRFEKGAQKSQANKAKKGLSESFMYAFDSYLEPVPASMLAGSRKLELPRWRRYEFPWIFTMGDEGMVDFPLRTFDAVNLDYAKIMDYDLAFLIEMLLSFMIIILGFNAVGQDRQEGTLKLLASFPLPRISIYLGKVLALFSISLLSLLLTTTLFLTVISFELSFSWVHSIIRILPAFLVFSGGYLLFWIFISLFFSSITATPQRSLALLLSCWILFVFVIPASVKLMTINGDVRSNSELSSQYQALEKQMMNQAFDKGGYYRGQETSESARDNYKPERILATMMESNMRKLDAFEEQIVTDAFNQVKKTEKLALFSPAMQYRYICESLCGTGMRAYHTWFEGVKRYRLALYDFFKQMDAKDPESLHLMFLPNYMSKKAVSYDLYPTFQTPSDTWESHFPLLRVAVAAIIVCLAGFFALFAFVRQDV